MAIKNRFQNFLAKIAKSEEAVEMPPKTDMEYWLNEIADALPAIPVPGESDKGKYLHVNATTGALEWVTVE